MFVGTTEVYSRPYWSLQQRLRINTGCGRRGWVRIRCRVQEIADEGTLNCTDIPETRLTLLRDGYSLACGVLVAVVENVDHPLGVRVARVRVVGRAIVHLGKRIWVVAARKGRSDSQVTAALRGSETTDSLMCSCEGLGHICCISGVSAPCLLTTRLATDNRSAGLLTSTSKRIKPDHSASCSIASHGVLSHCIMLRRVPYAFPRVSR